MFMMTGHYLTVRCSCRFLNENENEKKRKNNNHNEIKHTKECHIINDLN